MDMSNSFGTPEWLSVKENKVVVRCQTAYKDKFTKNYNV